MDVFKKHVSAVHQDFLVVEKSTAESVDKTGKNVNKEEKFHNILDSKNRKTLHEVHKEEKQYLCAICKEAFVKESSLNDKFFLLPRVNQYKCNLCSVKSARYVTNIQERKKEHNCGECNAKFLLESDLKEHVLVVHDRKKEFKCFVCGSCFKEQNELSIHIHQIHRVLQYKCNEDICTAKFSRKLSLEIHIQNYHGATKKQSEAKIETICEIGSLKCLSCEEKIQPYMCSLCNNRYSHQESLKKHFDEAHNVEFRNKDSLLNHVSGHIQKNIKRNFPNQYQKDDQEGILLLPIKKPKIQEGKDILLEEKNHGKVLEGNNVEKIYMCESCNMCFSQEQGLKYHKQSIHNDVSDDIIRNLQNLAETPQTSAHKSLQYLGSFPVQQDTPEINNSSITEEAPFKFPEVTTTPDMDTEKILEEISLTNFEQPSEVNSISNFIRDHNNEKENMSPKLIQNNSVKENRSSKLNESKDKKNSDVRSAIMLVLLQGILRFIRELYITNRT